MFLSNTSNPICFENNSEYLDSEIYIALVGKYGSTGDVWMDMNSSALIAMNSSANTVLDHLGVRLLNGNTQLFYKIGNIPNKTIQIPKGLYAGRIFISFKSPMYLHFQ